MRLEISHLFKSYANGVRALDDVSLTIERGMYGLLGPNGAGKSTLMRTIATLQDADQGTIRLGEIDVLGEKERVRTLLGYLPQDFGVYPKISAYDMLDHLALLKGLGTGRRQQVEAMLERVNLFEHRKKSLASFSGGMRQRFGIAQALLGNPQLVIVDEPTAGLDPGERNRFYNLLSEVGENVILILSTHIVQDVMELCTNMAIINRGRVLFAGRPEEGTLALEGRIWRKSIAKADMAAHEQQYRVISTKLIGGRPLIHVYQEQDPGDGFTPSAPDLEDVFFSQIAGLA